MRPPRNYGKGKNANRRKCNLGSRMGWRRCIVLSAAAGGRGAHPVPIDRTNELRHRVYILMSICPPLAWHNLTFLISVHNYILIYVFLRHACLAWSCLLVYGRLLLSRRVRLSPFNWVCRFFFWRGIRQNGVLFTNKLSFALGWAVNAIWTGAVEFCPFSTISRSNRFFMS